MVHFIMQKKAAWRAADLERDSTAFNSDIFDYCGTFVPTGKRAFCLKGKAC